MSVRPLVHADGRESSRCVDAIFRNLQQKNKKKFAILIWRFCVLDGAPNRRKLDSIMVAALVRSERGKPASFKPPAQHAENKHVRDDGFVTPLVALRGFKKTAAELGLL